MKNILYNNKMSGYFCFIVCKVIFYILDQSIYSNVYFIVDLSWTYEFDSQFFPGAMVGMWTHSLIPE